MIRTLLVCLFLASATVAVYWPVVNCGFVDLDDPDNVTINPQVPRGITPQGVRWAFVTTNYADYWHPVTWLSLMLDTDLYGGLKPAGFHLTNLILHVINVLLMFGVLRSMTSAFWPSAIVAAWFGLHPMHVESVAWVTERKDMLSAMFWLLTMWAYTSYARRGGIVRYLLIIVPLALGLMSKPMVVTLPFVLLLLDFWPLKRVDPWSENQTPRLLARLVLWLVMEKLPLLALAAASSLITYHQGSKAVADISLRLRGPNAVISYLRYIIKMVWPSDLAVYYSYPGMFGAKPWAWWVVGGSILVLAVITVGALALSRKRPYLIVGWLWYLGTLVPVIGLLQVGNQSIADRFTYVPYTGLFIMIAWSAADMIARRPVLRLSLIGAAVLTLAGCMILSWRQVQTWHDSDSMYQHALAATDHNWKMHDYFGNYLFNQKRYDKAIQQFQQASDLWPSNAETHLKLGHVLSLKPDTYSAKLELEKATSLAPKNPEAHFNLGIILALRHEDDEAIGELLKVIDLEPNHAEAHHNLGILLSQRGQTAEAIEHLQKAIDLSPARAQEYRKTLAAVRGPEGQ